MSQLIQHYQTSFKVCGGNKPAGNKLYQAQYAVGEWIKGIEKRRPRSSNPHARTSFWIRGDFTHRAHYASDNSWCDTNFCEMENSSTWAVEYTHRDRDERNVFWVSEIGLQEFKDSDTLVVYVKISYKISSEVVLAGTNFSPVSTIPNVVATLIATFDDCKFYSGDRDVTNTIGSFSKVKTQDDARDLGLYINDDNRKLAVVLLAGDSSEAQEEADYLQRNLFGKALVYIVDYNIQYLSRMNVRMTFGECAFIPPFRIFNGKVASNLHYMIANHKDADEKKGLIFKAWLAVHPVTERGVVDSVEKVSKLITIQLYRRIQRKIAKMVSMEEYEKIRNDLNGLQDDIVELKAENEEYDSSNKELAKQLGEKTSELGQKDDKILELEIKSEEQEKQHKLALHNANAEKESLARRKNSQEIPEVSAFPKSFKELRDWMPFFKNLTFADDAWKPAFEYDRFKNFEDAYNMLRDMDRILWPALFVKNSNNPAHDFDSQSQYVYARGEGTKTRKDGKFASDRKFVFEGKEYEMWTHIKFGNKSGEQLRIHFAIDTDNKRIIVGWIGEHMDNATTATLH